MQSPTHLQNFAVVIPAFNEAATIRDIASRALVYSPLVIIIDDGSTDSTKAALEGLPVTLIEHKTNQGKAASLWDGITAARAHKVTYIVTLDGDGQHAPEDIPLLLAKTKTYPNHIVIGARLADKSLIPAKRYWANRIANFWIAWAAGYPISDSQSGFRVYPSHLFNDLTISTSKRSCFVFESEILIKAAQRNIKSHSVPIPAVYAKNARPSHFRGGRDITFITLMVARYLIIRGMYPQGLYRSCIKPHFLPQQGSRADFDGYLTLAISVALVILTLGSTLLLALIYVLRTAIKSGCSSQTHHLVVLGKQLHNNLLDHDYRLRLDRAKICFATNPNKLIYLLGGITGDADISEARAGQHYLENSGVSANSICIEESSHNTLENIKQLTLHNLIPERQICLISNRYHLARASLMAGGFGFLVERCAAEDQYQPGVIALLKLIIEAFHLHWYLTGRIYATLTRNKRMLVRISSFE